MDVNLIEMRRLENEQNRLKQKYETNYVRGLLKTNIKMCYPEVFYTHFI
jgi:hypothetical protein